MALLMLLGYLMCNVLLAWAMLQQLYLYKTLSSPPPQNPNNWIHSVIFEPQPKIQLTHLSYKVTSFLDFQPFINGFQSVNNYLDNLWADIQDPYYFQHLFIPIAHINIDPTVNDSHIEKFLRSCACGQCPYACQAKMKFEKFKWEIHYIIKIFHAIYKKFLTAIDHIDYHPSQIQSSITRTKRSVTYDIYKHYYSPTKTLTPSEESFLNVFMEALLFCNPKFVSKNNWYFGLSSRYFLYPLTSLPKMVKQEMPASIEQG